MKLQGIISCLGLLACATSYGRTEMRAMAEYPERPYLVYIPDGLDQDQAKSPVPVVMSLHGMGSNGEEQQINSCADGQANSETCLDRLADRDRFLVVYPNGEKIGTGCRLPNRECFPRRWRPNGGCGIARSEIASQEKVPPSQDHQYLRAVLADIENDYSVDNRRIFFAGMSNGASMAFDISCSMKDRVAAVALIAGTGYVSDSCVCGNGPRPDVIHFHGTTDPVWDYESGHGFVRKLARTSSCEDKEVSQTLPDLDPNDLTQVTQHDFQGCQGGGLVHYEITGGGHTWPGGFLYSQRVGRVTRDITGNEIIWQFFQTHPKKPDSQKQQLNTRD